MTRIVDVDASLERLDKVAQTAREDAIADLDSGALLAIHAMQNDIDDIKGWVALHKPKT